MTPTRPEGPGVGTLIPPWRPRLRSSSWPLARALGCGPMFPRFFIGLPGGRLSSGSSMRLGRRVPGGSSRWSVPVTGLPRGCRTASRSPSSARGRAPGPLFSPLARPCWRMERPRSVFVLSGDQPLITARAAHGLLAEHDRQGAVATLLTTERIDPAGFGRVVRDGKGNVERIFETKHTGRPLARRSSRSGRSTSAPTSSTPTPSSRRSTRSSSSASERYLTGVFPVIRESGGIVAAHMTDDADARHRRQRPRRPHGRPRRRPSAASSRRTPARVSRSCSRARRDSRQG